MAGETFDLDGMTFVVTDLKRQRLGDMTDAMPGRRLSESDLYRIYFKNACRHDLGADSLVWVHSFFGLRRLVSGLKPSATA